MSPPTPDRDPDRLKTLDVELTPRQVAWVQREAEKQNRSVDQLLRSILTDRIRREKRGAVSRSRTEAPSPSSRTSNSAAARVEDASTCEDKRASSVVESLRSASKQLEDLTEDEVEADPSDLSDTLDRLEAQMGEDGGSSEPAATQEESESVLLDRSSRSMFDLVEEG